MGQGREQHSRLRVFSARFKAPVTFLDRGVDTFGPCWTIPFCFKKSGV